MKVIRTTESNVNLTLPGDKTGDRDLPATRIRAYDPELGETEADAHPAFESHWVADADELIRIQKGAPVIMTLHGERHPPVSLSVAQVADEAVQLWLGHKQVIRALEWTHGRVEQLASEDEQIDPIRFVELFFDGLKETAQPPDPDQRTLDTALPSVEQTRSDDSRVDDSNADNDSGGGAGA